jgi:pimeloyl-ACP methyl ester carboxylesterase
MNSWILPEEEFMVPVRGGNLAVFRYGAEGGKAALLLHGITSSNRAWPFFARELVERGYTAYAPDLRGRGRSNSLPGPYGMELHARDMASVIDYFELKDVAIFGHSMGGFIAVVLAATLPEKIGKTVLIDGGLLFPLPNGITVKQLIPLVLGPVVARLGMVFESQEAYRELWKTNPALGNVWGPVLDEYSDYDLQGEAPNFRPRTSLVALEEDTYDEFESESIPNALAKLSNASSTEEILLVRTVRGLQNEDTPLYPFAATGALLEKYPRIVLRTVEDVNHYDVLLSERGAKECIRVIFGEN